MKRLLFILLALLLLAGCEDRTGKEEPHPAPSGETEQKDDPSEPSDPAELADFLPDFLVLREKSYGADYQNVAPWQMQAYTDELKAEGFALEANDYQSLYFKDDVLIEIHDSVASNQQCSVKVSLAQRVADESVLTCEDFQRELNEPGIFYVLEQTPPGFYKETGGRIFLVATKYAWASGSAPTYSTFYSIVTPNKMLPLNAHNNIAPPVCFDLDGDGSTEILTLGYGPTSGLFTFTLRAYAIVEGTPVLDGEKTFMVDAGDVTIGKSADGVLLYYTPNEIIRWRYLEKTKEIPIHLENHRFSLETARASDPEPWLETAADYGLLVTQADLHLDVYAWMEGDTYWCGLTAHASEPFTADTLNGLCPVTLEEMREILAMYPGNPENIAVYLVERPALSEVYEVQAEAILLKAIRAHLLKEG